MSIPPPPERQTAPDPFPTSSPGTAELPILEATLELIRWFVPILHRLPRQHRFGLGDRLIANLYELMAQLAMARFQRQKLPILEPLAGRLHLIQLQTRLLHEFSLIDLRRYEHASRLSAIVMPLRELYPRLTSFANLHAAAHGAQLGKRYRPAVLSFHANLEAELLRLQEELRSFIYRPGPYRQFHIRDPKPRLISAAPYRDRVVHHALCAVIVPPLERRFHPGSFANRRGYGSHRALCRIVAAAARHRWVLQGDIRLYFPSLDLTLLRRQLSERIACPGTLWLLDQILANGATSGPALDAFPGDTLLTPLERPRGLPIGNLTSQFLANLHLDRFDHTIGALSGIRAYLR